MPETEKRLPETTEEVEVYAPSDARQYRAVPLPGETKQETEFAQRAFEAILERAGY